MSNCEKTDDYIFLFKSVKNGVQDFNPKVLIANGSDAITNSFVAVFGKNYNRIMFWAHVYRALDKNIKNYCVDITSCNEIMDDVMFLQLCQSQTVFQKASELFLTKWQDEKHFCDYFTNELLHKHPGWYEGYM